MRGMTLGGWAKRRAIHTARVLLQKTRSILKRILQNLASVLGGEAMVRAASFTAAIVIARHDGPAILGLYGACLAAVTIVFMFAESGLQLSAITEIGAVRGQAAWVVGQLYLSKVILCAFAVVVLFAVGAHGGFPRIYWVIGGLITLRTLIQSCSQLQIAILKSLFRMHLIGIIQAFHAGVLFLGIGIAFVQDWSMVTLLEILVAGQTLELLFMSGAVYSARIHPRWPVFSKCLALMRRSVPLGLGYALANLIVRADVVVLSLLVPLPEIGQFSAADNLLVVTYLAAWILGSVLLPEMVQFSDSAYRLDQFMSRWIRLTAKIAIPAALILFLIAPRAITVLYGPDFAHAGVLASWMILACPFIVFNSLFLHHTIATGAKIAYLRIMFVAAVFAALLAYFLGRRFGAAGVVAAILIRESLLSVVLWLRHSRTSGVGVEIGASALS
ncbi:MAG TPA: oligosaccharide flippase family protein [Candidatus Sulfotelmatobacter sp.]|jgi:O-antigen/teichoic acid export membrane protein